MPNARANSLIDHYEPASQIFCGAATYGRIKYNEAPTLQWSIIHDDHIHLPMTKNSRSLDLPILQLHHEILAPLRRLSRKWVFPSPKSMVGHITKRERLMSNPYMHCRTFATVAMEECVLEEIVGRPLNETQLSITGQKHARPYLDALRASMEAACTEILARADKWGFCEHSTAQPSHGRRNTGWVSHRSGS